VTIAFHLPATSALQGQVSSSASWKLSAGATALTPSQDAHIQPSLKGSHRGGAALRSSVTWNG
jgi:hypothetical protein